MLERLTKEGVGQLSDMKTSELSQMASSVSTLIAVTITNSVRQILRRPSAAPQTTLERGPAADNLAEAIAEEVLRRDILLFSPKEVGGLRLFCEGVILQCLGVGALRSIWWRIRAGQGFLYGLYTRANEYL